MMSAMKVSSWTPEADGRKEWRLIIVIKQVSICWSYVCPSLQTLCSLCDWQLTFVAAQARITTCVCIAMSWLCCSPL